MTQHTLPSVEHRYLKNSSVKQNNNRS